MKTIIDETIEAANVVESKPLTDKPNVTTAPEETKGIGAGAIIFGIAILVLLVALTLWAVSYFKKRKEQKLLNDGTGTE